LSKIIWHFILNQKATNEMAANQEEEDLDRHRFDQTNRQLNLNITNDFARQMDVDDNHNGQEG
jgi:hypothetical protein